MAAVMGLMLAIFGNGDLNMLKSWWSGSGKKGGRSVEGDRVVRGDELIDYDRAKSHAEGFCAVYGNKAAIQWAGVQLPISFGTQHFLILGSSGSGKTLCLRLLMQSVLPQIRKGKAHRALIYDAKRDILSVVAGMKLEGEVVTLNPFDRRGVAWDIAADVTDGAVAHQVASLLVPVEDQMSQKFFVEAAQGLLGGLLEAFAHLSGSAWTLRDVVLACVSRREPRRF